MSIDLDTAAKPRRSGGAGVRLGTGADIVRRRLAANIGPKVFLVIAIEVLISGTWRSQRQRGPTRWAQV
jgi:hypothetical protein